VSGARINRPSVPEEGHADEGIKGAWGETKPRALNLPRACEGHAVHIWEKNKSTVQKGVLPEEYPK